MAKHSSKRSPDGKRVRRVRPRLALRTPFSTQRSTQQEVLRGAENVLAEVERSTGLRAVKLVDLRRGARGGSMVVVEVESTRSGADAAPDWYVVGLNAEGRVVSCTLTQRPSLESGATSDAPLDAMGVVHPALPVELGLRADLDTNVGISLRRFNVINLRLRGSITPSGHKRFGRRRSA